MINNIDVTLRDGGYQNNFDFTLDYAIQHVKAMSESNVEWIEIGYKNGSFKPIPGIGLTGRGDNEYIREIYQAVPDANLCMIAHAHNISSKDIEEMRAMGVGMLRLCLSEENKHETFEYAHLAKSLGYTVCVNATRVSQSSLNQLISLAWEAKVNGVDVFYLADSNGSMTPEQVSRFVSTLKNATDMQIGFHAHDNLSLAMANSIEAFKAGANYIDSSLHGMGKGSGNLNLESWLSYIQNSGTRKNYSIGQILNQLESLKDKSYFSKPERNVIDMILGMKNLSVEHKSHPEFKEIRDISMALHMAEQLHEAAL